MRWQFWKKSAPAGKKSHDYFNAFQYLSASGWGQVTAWQALRYYERISPVATGVDKVVDEFKSIQPSIFDSETQRYTTDHDVLTFLRRPNAYQSWMTFVKSYGTYYEICGEVYLLATGNPNQPPKELTVIAPQFVTIDMGTDGLPMKYIVNNGNNRSSVFTRKEDSSGVRFYNGDRELWHVKNFNPNASSTNWHGASVLNSIYYEVEQHLYSSRHNLSLLKQGGRLTGALIAESTLSDDQFSRLQKQINDTMAGADNAGSVKLFEGGLKYEEMGKTNRDMDFLKLKQEVMQAIFLRLKIPLPLVNPNTMTLSNYQTAQISLYDNAVLPLASKLYGEIQLFIGARFRLGPLESIAVDTATISALEPRRLDNLKKKSDLHILSTNEKRGESGYEAISGGDSVLAPATLLPIGIDTDTTSNRTDQARRKFVEILQQQENPSGGRLWTDDQIKSLADMEYGCAN